MSNLTLAVGRPTLADRVFARGLPMDIALVAAGAGLTAIARPGGDSALAGADHRADSRRAARRQRPSARCAARSRWCSTRCSASSGCRCSATRSHGVGVHRSARPAATSSASSSPPRSSDGSRSATGTASILGAALSFLAGTRRRRSLIGLPWLAVVAAPEPASRRFRPACTRSSSAASSRRCSPPASFARPGARSPRPTSATSATPRLPAARNDESRRRPILSRRTAFVMTCSALHREAERAHHVAAVVGDLAPGPTAASRPS